MGEVRNQGTEYFRVYLACAGLLLAACGQMQENRETQEEPPPEPGPVETCERRDVEPVSAELPVWDLFVSLKRWDALHEDLFVDLAVDATLCMDGEMLPASLELQGASTRRQGKKSFDIKFNRDVEPAVDPLGADDPRPRRRLLLKAMAADHSMVREALAFELWRGMGYQAPRVEFVNLRINGVYWGLYNIVEPINRDYLRRRGIASTGHLYKAVRRDDQKADLSPGRNLRRVFEHKSDGLPGAYRDLERLVTALQTTEPTADAFEREIDAVFPLDVYMDRMIWVAVTQNEDAVAQNYYLYNEPVGEDDTWHIVPWDSNIAFGADWRGADHVRDPAEAPMVDGNNHFGKRLTAVRGLREEYVERFRAALSDSLSVERIDGLHEELAARVAHDLALDQERWSRTLSPSQAQEHIREHVRARPKHLEHALEELLDQDTLEPDKLDDPSSDLARDDE